MALESAAALVSRLRPGYKGVRPGRVLADTTEFMDIVPGDILALRGRHYLVLANAVERALGYVDAKFWVKRCLELETGARRIVKCVFHESFPLRLGGVEVRCYRSPVKEARILDLVRGDERFMQGASVKDAAGNLVRVIEPVAGTSLEKIISRLEMDHRAYFTALFPGLFARFTGACQAIADLNATGERHGDIGRDHLWIEHATGNMRWIDFDYAYEIHENPFGVDVMGLGDILIFLAGKGVHTPQGMAEAGIVPARPLTSGDFSLVFGNRLANLRLIYPYLPEELNRIMMHFAADSEVFYESAAELLEDLRHVSL